MSQAPVTKELNLEIEVKLACDDLDRFRKAGLPLTLETPRHFEDNWLLDLLDQSLLKQGAALRVRSVDGKGTLTYKGVVKQTHESRLKVREEIETAVDEPERVIELFERLGYRRSFRYQKYRTGYSVPLGGRVLKVLFDETPIGSFIEIEGDENSVLKALDTAGFSTGDIIRESYPELQAARCKALGIPLEDLIF
ncbi:MAG TPA: class IV adenylate cyclase [Blastocatellia bacterium]|nr:class IV adenylate cyclase [Blastocatellia bacterium]